jgi:hypothetical protein
MANTDVDLKTLTLFNQEVGRGYNVKVEIDFNDLITNAPSGEVDDDTQTYKIVALPAGSYVRSVYYWLKEAFDDSGSGSSLTLQIGDEDDADGFLEAKQIHVDGTEVTAALADGAYRNAVSDEATDSNSDTVTVTTPSAVEAKVYTADKNLEALLTPSSYKLSECTQGKLVILADIVFASKA